MIDVDVRGRYEAELLRSEAVRIADTEAALRSVLDGEVVVPLDTRRGASTGPVLTRRPASRRRWIQLAAGVVAAAAVVAVLVARRINDPAVVPPADTVVTSSTELAEPPAPWSPELQARTLDPPITCFRSASATGCPQLAVAPDGTLVEYDPAAATLTWYEDEPRIVPVTADLTGTDFDLTGPGYSGPPSLMAIGPHDVAYFLLWSPRKEEFVAVAPSGAEITRDAGPSSIESMLMPTASGIVAMPCVVSKNRCTGGSEWPAPDAPLATPWVDLAGDHITDARPYPAAKGTDTGIEVRFGEREWLVAGEPWRGHAQPQVFPRSDGGVVMLHDLTFDGPRQPVNLIELLPDGTIERYVVPRGTVLPDGSIIIEQNDELIRLTPPT
jgi:hypothetical protein